MFMATTWKSTPELCTINLFEHFWPLEILVIGGWTYTESNIKVTGNCRLRVKNILSLKMMVIHVKKYRTTWTIAENVTTLYYLILWFHFSPIWNGVLIYFSLAKWNQTYTCDADYYYNSWLHVSHIFKYLYDTASKEKTTLGITESS